MLESLLPVLGYAVLEHHPVDGLQWALPAPDWCRGSSPEELSESLYFLDHFLEDASQVWSGVRNSVERSVPWTQRDRDGLLAVYCAIAVLHEGRRLLLIDHYSPEAVACGIAVDRAREHTLTHEQIEREQEEAGRLEKLRTDFMNSLSHELRTPLNAIIGFARLLEMGNAGSLNERQRGFVAHVSESASQLLDRINRGLEFTSRQADGASHSLDAPSESAKSQR